MCLVFVYLYVFECVYACTYVFVCVYVLVCKKDRTMTLFDSCAPLNFLAKRCPVNGHILEIRTKYFKLILFSICVEISYLRVAICKTLIITYKHSLLILFFRVIQFTPHFCKFSKSNLFSGANYFIL